MHVVFRKANFWVELKHLSEVRVSLWSVTELCVHRGTTGYRSHDPVSVAVECHIVMPQ